MNTKEFIDEPYQMTCGSYEAEIRTYKKYEGKQGNIWLVANQEEAADNIYVHKPKDTKSQGFAGRTLEFKLEDGTIYKAQGPWHSNADSLYEDTGVDVRDTHSTFVVLGMERTFVDWQSGIKDIVYQDEKPTLGRYDRYKEIMKKYPEAKYYFMKSRGGASCGPTESYYKELNKPK